ANRGRHMNDGRGRNRRERMHLLSMTIMVSSALMLAGCVTESSYKQAQEIVKGSPAMKRDAIARCYRGTDRASAARKAEMAKIMNVSPRSNVARIYCTRA